jgi:hypothetical protein
VIFFCGEGLDCDIKHSAKLKIVSCRSKLRVDGKKGKKPSLWNGTKKPVSGEFG